MIISIKSASRIGIFSLCLTGVACGWRAHSDPLPSGSFDAGGEPGEGLKPDAKVGPQTTGDVAVAPDVLAQSDVSAPIDVPAVVDVPTTPQDTAPRDAALDTASPDMPPGCQSVCSSNEQRCGAGGVQACAVQADGCRGWGPASPCPAGMSCKQAGTAASCTCDSGGCVLGTQQCVGANGMQTCVMSGACTAWGPMVGCQGATTCHQTGSTASCCADACTVGAQQCGSGGVQTCVKNGACASWGSPTSCESPKACQASGSTASCVCPGAACSVGTKKCGPSGTGLQTCVMTGACSDWGAESACPGPQNSLSMCSNGTCSWICKTGYMLCSANSTCVVSRRTFDASAEGVRTDQLPPSTATPITVGQFLGRSVISTQVRFSVTSGEVGVLRVPVCTAGFSLRNKRLAITYYLEGPPPPDNGLIAMSVTGIRVDGSFLFLPGGAKYLDVGAWSLWSESFPDDADSDNVAELELRIGIMGGGTAAWSGTFHIDDMVIN